MGVIKSMRYYHYLSASKVEMLFPQIPLSFLDGLKVELGFDFGLLKGKISGEHRDPATLVAKVNALEKFFEREKTLRTDIVEGTWLRSRFTGRMGFIPDHEGLVLFGGMLQTTTLLLAGSESNLISGSANPGKDSGWSFMPRTLHSLKKYVEQDMDLLDVEVNETPYPGKVATSYVFGSLDDRIEGARWRAFHSFPEDALPEPTMEMSVLARIFLYRENGRGEALAIGSPLYVSE